MNGQQTKSKVNSLRIKRNPYKNLSGHFWFIKKWNQEHLPNQFGIKTRAPIFKAMIRFNHPTSKTLATNSKTILTSVKSK
jgi:hypothetical protein